jgi:hypothetical protein
VRLKRNEIIECGQNTEFFFVLKQVSNMLLDLYSLRLIVILNLEIVGCVLRFCNNVIIACRKLPVGWYVGIVPTLLGTMPSC